MQKKGKDYSLQTIFIKKRDIKTLNLASEKKALRHYLTTIEYMTRDSFFQKKGSSITSKKYAKISKNSFKPIFALYERTGIFTLKKGLFGRMTYSYPNDYPKSQEEWLKVKGGFLKVDRGELLSLLKNLSDNELRVYFALKLIHEANYRDDDRHLGVTTYPKVLRESHVKISQKTLKSCLDSLSEKEMITLAEPIQLEARQKSQFLFCLISQKIRTLSQKIPAEIAQSPEKSVHLKENNFKLDNNLNQGRKSEKFSPKKSKSKTDFNFWGLDKLDRPLSIKTIKHLINREGFTKEEVQESIMRFSKYYFSSADIRNEYKNPIGFLYSHMKKFNQIFIEPEWWLELQHREDLGEDRFKYKSKSEAIASSRADSVSQKNFFAEIWEYLEKSGEVISQTT